MGSRLQRPDRCRARSPPCASVPAPGTSRVRLRRPRRWFRACRRSNRRLGNPGPERISTACGCAHSGCRSGTARHRTARRRCAAESRSPCRPRCPASRWRADWGTHPAAPPARLRCRRRSDENRSHPRRCRRAAGARRRSGALRCSAWRPDYRRRHCRSCPDHRSADSARQNPAPAAPARRRSPGRRADGTSPSPRRRSWRISSARRRDRGEACASHKGCAGAPA